MSILPYARYARENQIDIRTVVENIADKSDDFEVDEHRFILTTEIDRIMCEELESDLYILGCFNASFLAPTLEIEQDIIEDIQEMQAFNAVGRLVISLKKLEELQADYASADGYGHYFNSYDGDEIELKGYHIFKMCA